MSNPEFHICPNCRYQWKHGQDGEHSCVERLVEQRNEAIKLIHGLSATLHFWRASELIGSMSQCRDIRDEYIEKSSKFLEAAE